MYPIRTSLFVVVLLSAPAGLLAQQSLSQKAPGHELDPTGKTISISVHADQPRGALQPIWRFFGYDEANYTFAPDGKQLLTEIAKLHPQPAYIRTHHLLTSGTGETWLKWSSTGVYDEDAQGNPIYNWFILDRIFDTFLEHGLKPYVELGFMPRALSTNPENYTPEKVLRGRPRGSVGGGAFYPPKNYRKWQAFIETLARHCADRYGRAEAESWYWELWNEPDISYWRGTPQEYLRLYDHTAAAIKRALPGASLGGPHVTNPTSENSERFLRRFIEHCLGSKNTVAGKTGVPLDLVAFHAKGGTSFVDGHVRMNLANHLRTIDRGCAIIASYPELKDMPVIIGESDPDGCAACSSEFYPQNAYRNGAQYASYTVATFMRKQAIAERHGVNLDGAVTWAFAFENQPWFAGFRTLATNGVAKPVFNAFRMFSLLEEKRVAVENSAQRSLDELTKREARATTDIDAMATRSEQVLSVIVWHHHDDGVPGPAVGVNLTVEGLPKHVQKVKLSHYRIDKHHSNAYTLWQKMGSPQNPTSEQYAALQKASQLTLLEPIRPVQISEGEFSLQFELPRHAVSLVRLEW